MFRVVYSAASKFKYIAQTLAKINDEGMLGFTLDGLVAWIMSPDKTSLAILRAPMLAFDEYNVEEESKFTVRMDEINKIVRRATRNDDMIIEYDPDTQSIMLTLRDRKTGVPRTFLIPIIEVSPVEYREPKLESTARFTMMADDFKNLIQDVKVVSDFVTLEAEGEVVIARASAEEREYEWVMKVGEPLIDLEVDESTKATYSRTALEAAIKPVGAAENVRVEYATDYPLRVEFTFPNTEKLYIYVAPALE